MLSSLKLCGSSVELPGFYICSEEDDDVSTPTTDGESPIVDGLQIPPYDIRPIESRGEEKQALNLFKADGIKLKIAELFKLRSRDSDAYLVAVLGNSGLVIGCCVCIAIDWKIGMIVNCAINEEYKEATDLLKSQLLDEAVKHLSPRYVYVNVKVGRNVNARLISYTSRWNIDVYETYCRMLRTVSVSHPAQTLCKCVVRFRRTLSFCSEKPSMLDSRFLLRYFDIKSAVGFYIFQKETDNYCYLFKYFGRWLLAPMYATSEDFARVILREVANYVRRQPEIAGSIMAFSPYRPEGINKSGELLEEMGFIKTSITYKQKFSESVMNDYSGDAVELCVV
ncbi:uncharacterized protein LOC111622371 [Centruroides sculpturatus]|uniref:uncharacterized protein LOC111622371 n=1 Tax=Centruroides sculpturatus TaxID=218467 RepID=UPI000C6D249E|nr:uncharacterized protein LOC111622371 [Centruroides sculpturatus]